MMIKDDDDDPDVDWHHAHMTICGRNCDDDMIILKLTKQLHLR